MNVLKVNGKWSKLIFCLRVRYFWRGIMNMYYKYYNVVVDKKLVMCFFCGVWKELKYMICWLNMKIIIILFLFWVSNNKERVCDIS